MSALRQYLDLYRQVGDRIDAHSAPALNALRPRAARVLEDATLPKQGADNYENCDLQAMLEPDYGINIDEVNLSVKPENTFRCDMPMTGESPVLCVNDRTLMPDNFPQMPDGVLVGSLRAIAKSHPEIVERYYGRLADIDNPVVALDTMLARDGFMLYVPGNVRLEAPIQLINILSALQPLMAVRRVLVVLEDGAEARLLICDHTQREEVNLLALQTVEIYVGRNAELHYYDLEESSQRTGRISSLYLSQEADSRVTIDGMTLFNGTTRNEYHCRFAGENAGLRLYGMAIEDRQRKVSTYSRIDHAVPRCVSNELFKMSADGESRCAFTGRIIVRPECVKTEAYQACRNLLAADTARIEARPELEIYNDDVKCSHGCAIGQLDEMQVFYMRSRGIPEPQARLLLRQAFMADVIDIADIPGLRDRLHLLVEKRFAGAEAACSNCGAQ